VQQQIFPRASVEVGYYRRSFTMFTTGGTVTDNLLVSPADLATYSITAPADSRLAQRRRLHGWPALQPEPERVRPSNLLIMSTKKVATTHARSTAST